MSSSIMTPKEKTSDLSVSLPLEAYSGARYLHAYTNSRKYGNIMLALCSAEMRHLLLCVCVCLCVLTRKYP